MKYQKRRIALLGDRAPIAAEGETIEGAEQQRLGGAQTAEDILAEARANKSAEYEVKMGYLMKQLDFVQVQALIESGLQRFGRVARMQEDIEDAPQEGSLRVRESLRAGYYSILDDVDGYPYYLWVDLDGYLRIKSSEPASDTDGQVVGPPREYRGGVDVCPGADTSHVIVTRGTIDIDGMTKTNASDITYNLDWTVPSLLWEGPVPVASSWYFVWACPDAGNEPGFHAIMTRLSQPTTVFAPGGTPGFGDTTAAWTPDQLKGSLVGIVAGTGSVRWYTITGNSATIINVAGWDVAPDTNSFYMIRPIVNDYKVRLIGQLWMSTTTSATPHSINSNYMLVANDYRDVSAAGTVIVIPWQYAQGNSVPFYLDRPARIHFQVSIYIVTPTDGSHNFQAYLDGAAWGPNNTQQIHTDHAHMLPYAASSVLLTEGLHRLTFYETRPNIDSTTRTNWILQVIKA